MLQPWYDGSFYGSSGLEFAKGFRWLEEESRRGRGGGMKRMIFFGMLRGENGSVADVRC